jgi:hypothetical protein
MGEFDVELNHAADDLERKVVASEMSPALKGVAIETGDVAQGAKRHTLVVAAFRRTRWPATHDVLEDVVAILLAVRRLLELVPDGEVVRPIQTVCIAADHPGRLSDALRAAAGPCPPIVVRSVPRAAPPLVWPPTSFER